jgi:hypothetical protein
METGNWKLENGNWKLETGKWKARLGAGSLHSPRRCHSERSEESPQFLNFQLHGIFAAMKTAT